MSDCVGAASGQNPPLSPKGELLPWDWSSPRLKSDNSRLTCNHMVACFDALKTAHFFLMDSHLDPCHCMSGKRRGLAQDWFALRNFVFTWVIFWVTTPDSITRLSGWWAPSQPPQVPRNCPGPEDMSQPSLEADPASPLHDDDCFYYHSWRNDVVIAFGTLLSFLT